MMRFWLEALFKLTLDFGVCLPVDTGLDHTRVVLQLLRRHPGMVVQLLVFTFLPASYCRDPVDASLLLRYELKHQSEAWRWSNFKIDHCPLESSTAVSGILRSLHGYSSNTSGRSMSTSAQEVSAEELKTAVYHNSQIGRVPEIEKQIAI